MRRFFVEKTDITDENAKIFEQEFIHITKVLRCQPGEKCILLDGSGYEYLSEIDYIDEMYVSFKIFEKKSSETEPETRVTLYQGLPKSMKLDTVIQKTVELGVFSIIPFISSRCVKIPNNGFDRKKERLERIALEAVKQCKRAVVPEISNPLSFESLFESSAKHELTLLCYEGEEKTDLKSVLEHSDAKDIGLIIGPEGGFSSSEAEKLIETGATPISLGKRILRTETAGMAALAMIMYEKDEMV